MNTKKMNAKNIFVALMIAGFLAFQTSVVFAQSSEQSDKIVETLDSQQSDRLEGSWRATVTPPGGAVFQRSYHLWQRRRIDCIGARRHPSQSASGSSARGDSRTRSLGKNRKPPIRLHFSTNSLRR